MLYLNLNVKYKSKSIIYGPFRFIFKINKEKCAKYEEIEQNVQNILTKKQWWKVYIQHPIEWQGKATSLRGKFEETAATLEQRILPVFAKMWACLRVVLLRSRGRMLSNMKVCWSWRYKQRGCVEKPFEALQTPSVVSSGSGSRQSSQAPRSCRVELISLKILYECSCGEHWYLYAAT